MYKSKGDSKGVAVSSTEVGRSSAASGSWKPSGPAWVGHGDISGEIKNGGPPVKSSAAARARRAYNLEEDVSLRSTRCHTLMIQKQEIQDECFGSVYRPT